jgi:hypothetical protein
VYLRWDNATFTVSPSPVTPFFADHGAALAKQSQGHVTPLARALVTLRMLTVLAVRGVGDSSCNVTRPTLRRSSLTTELQFTGGHVFFRGIVVVCLGLNCEDHRLGERALKVKQMRKHVFQKDTP